MRRFLLGVSLFIAALALAAGGSGGTSDNFARPGSCPPGQFVTATSRGSSPSCAAATLADGGTISQSSIISTWQAPVTFCAPICGAPGSYASWSGQTCSLSGATSSTYDARSCLTAMVTGTVAGAATSVSTGIADLYDDSGGTATIWLFTGPSLADLRLWSGMAADQWITSGKYTTSTPATSYAAFRYVNGLDANWQCCVAPTGGAPATCADSGISVAASTRYKLQIQTTGASSSLKWTINDVAVCSGRSAAGKAGVGWYVGTSGNLIAGGAARTWYWGGHQFVADRP